MLDLVRTGEDVELAAELLGCSIEDLAKGTGIGVATLKRWVSGATRPSHSSAGRFYEYAYGHGLRINEIRAQFHKETCEHRGNVALFHGSKKGLDGAPSLERCNPHSDFGRGFYCGENLEQAASFVSMHDSASVYLAEFNPKGLTRIDFAVNEDWMLAIAWFRGRLNAYTEHPRARKLIGRVSAADFAVAPIADNRMYELMTEFIDGEITDVVCQHGLSATDLGSQYVLLTQAALDSVSITEELFLCDAEKASRLEYGNQQRRVGIDKTKAAKRAFRGQGFYIDELLA